MPKLANHSSQLNLLDNIMLIKQIQETKFKLHRRINRINNREEFLYQLKVEIEEANNKFSHSLTNQTKITQTLWETRCRLHK